MNRWEYNEEYNYWDCFLYEKDGHKKHRIVIQPLSESYSFRFYMENRNYPEIKEYIKAKNIEEAIKIATEYINNYIKKRAIYWSNLSCISENFIKEMKK